MELKEIAFKPILPNERALEGHKDGVIFHIYEDCDKASMHLPAYYVVAYDTEGKGREINTAGHRYFYYDGVKQFCKKIAAGEVNLERMREQFAAEDIAEERAAIREAAERAENLYRRLIVVRLPYTELLDLEALHEEMGDLAHNILLGVERGEGWPECCG